MNRAYIYSIGDGRSEIEKLLSSLKQAVGVKHRIICPNRMAISSLKDKLVQGKGGLMGLEFTTFDDFAKTHSFMEVKEDSLLMAYIFQQKLKKNLKDFPFLKDSLHFLSTVEYLLEFFAQLIQADFGQGDWEKLPYIFKEELYKAFCLYGELAKDLDFLRLDEAYSKAGEYLREGIFPKESIILIGFSAFRSMEIRLLESMIQGGFSLEIHLPFDQVRRKSFFQNTLDQLKALGFSLHQVEKKSASLLGDYCEDYTLQGEDLNKAIGFIQAKSKNLMGQEIFRQVGQGLEEGFSLDQMAVVCSNRQNKNFLGSMAKAFNIPLYDPLNTIDIDSSPLLQELETLYKYSEEGKNGLRERIFLRYFPLDMDPYALDSIFEALDFMDLGSLKKDIKSRSYLPLDEEGLQCLNHCLPLLEEDSARYKETSFSRQIAILEEGILGLATKELGEQDREICQHILEICKELRDYSPFLDQLEGADFFQLIVESLSRREARKLKVEKGLRILTLSQAFFINAPFLMFFNMTSDFPGKMEENFLKNKRDLALLNSLGLFKDEVYKADLEEIEFMQVLGQSQRSILFQAGLEDDLSPLFLQIKDSIERPKIQRIRSYSRENFYRWNSGPLAGPIMKDWENIHIRENLRGQALMQIQKAIRSKPYTATFIDSYMACPYKCLVENFLLEKESLFTIAGRRNLAIGNIYHRVLENYYRQNKSLEDVADLVDVESSRREHLDIFDPVEYSLLQYNMKRTLHNFIQVDQERTANEKKDKGFYPMGFEESYSFKIGDICWRGIIDRIDSNDQGQEILIDYKKSQGPSIASFNQDLSWQLSLYAYSRYLKGKEVVGLAYGNIESENFRILLRNVDKAGKYSRAESSQMFTQEQMEAFFQSIPQKIQAIIAKIEGGNFQPIPQDPNKCKYCSLGDICRKEEII